MARNTEIKARIASVQALLPIATALADGGPAQFIAQDDSFFRVPQGRLKLRVFANGTGELIHYHRANTEGPKVSDYVISPVPDPGSMRLALTRANGLLGCVRKRRILLLVGATRIHLDRVEGLGDFLELEVVLRDEQSAGDGERIAQDLLQRLGVKPVDMLRGAYLDLLMQRQSGYARSLCNPCLIRCARLRRNAAVGSRVSPSWAGSAPPG